MPRCSAVSSCPKGGTDERGSERRRCVRPPDVAPRLLRSLLFGTGASAARGGVLPDHSLREPEHPARRGIRSSSGHPESLGLRPRPYRARRGMRPRRLGARGSLLGHQSACSVRRLFTDCACVRRPAWQSRAASNAFPRALAVSPYQLFEACGRELGLACAQAGSAAVSEGLSGPIIQRPPSVRVSSACTGRTTAVAVSPQQRRPSNAARPVKTGCAGALGSERARWHSPIVPRDSARRLGLRVWTRRVSRSSQRLHALSQKPSSLSSAMPSMRSKGMAVLPTESVRRAASMPVTMPALIT